MIIIKLLMLVLVPALLLLPFLPIRWIFSFSFYSAPRVTRRRTLINTAVLVLLALVCTFLFPTLRNLVLAIGSFAPIQWLISKIPTYARYSTDLAVIIVVNLLYCAVACLVLLCVFSGERMLDRIKGLGKSAKDGKKKLKKKLGEIEKPRKTTIKEKDQDKKNNASDEETLGLPEELLPEPEEEVMGSRIILPGKIDEKKKPTKKKKKKDAAAQEPSAPPKGLRKLFDAICGLFYENVEDKWYARPQTHHAAHHLRLFLCLVGVTYTIVFILLLIPVLFHVTFLEEILYRILQFFVTVNYLYPVLALAILVLVFRLLDGKLSPIPPTELEEEAMLTQRGRVVDLDQVEANLMKTCGKDYDVQSFFSSDIVGNIADRATVDLSENELIRCVADYVKSEGLELNQEYLLGIKGLADGKNVLFHAPLYSAIGTYLYAALNLRIMQGERVVVICHNRSQISNYIEQMQQGFMRLTRTHKPLWKIVTRDELDRESEEDILVVTPEDFVDDSLFSEAESFFSQVTVALLPDANLVVSANNYYCQVISQRLRQVCRENLQYLFLSTRTILNLDNALTEFFLLDSKPVYARGDYSYGDVHIFVWRAKKDSAVMLDNAARTIPLEVCISDIANQFGVTEPNLISDSAIFSNQINPHWLDIYDATSRPLGFAIVADDSFNLPSVIHTYSRYIGKKASVLHVITRQYLLRDYFYANAPRYLFEQPLLERSMVEHAKPDKTAMILLLCRLMEGVPVANFISEMKRLGHTADEDSNEFETISQLVNCCLKTAIGHMPDNRQEHFTLYRPAGEFYPGLFVRVYENYDLFSRLMEETALVRIRFRSGTRSTTYINLFRRMLDQRYLEGQNLVFANQNYEIKSIDRKVGEIVVDDASSVHGLALDYVQLRNYSLNSESFAKECCALAAGNKPADPALLSMRKEFIGEENVVNAVVMARADSSLSVNSDTYGYYLVETDGSGLRVTDSSIPVIRLPDSKREQLRRETSTGIYLRIEMKRSRDDRLTMTLAALLQEMMKTLFPDYYFCLSVCPILENPAAIYEHPDHKSNVIASLYPRLEKWDTVTPDSIELLIVDDCVGGTGALDVLFEPEGTFLQNVLWMLSDYLNWQKESEASPYIFFGMDYEPGIFDMEGIRVVLQSFARAYVREHDIYSQLDTENRCTLCQQKIDEPYLWHGKYMICQECSEDYLPDEEEAAQILEYAKQYLIDTFSIKLPEVQVVFDDQLEGDTLSAIDQEEGTIHLAVDLPLRVMHVQIMTQLVRLWQLENLDITGDPMIDGQPLLVVNQYLRYLQQFQYAQYLHRRYLLGEDEASRGYSTLLQALQAEGHDNSFLFLLQQSKKSGKSPLKKFTQKKSSRVPKDTSVEYYYRSTLSETQARAYDDFLAAYMAHKDSVDLTAYQLTIDEVSLLHTCLRFDHPEVFWTNGLFEYTHNNGDDKVCTVHLTYTLTKEERERAQQEIDQATSAFLTEITEDMSDYEVALTLYKKMIELLDYDTLALEREKRKSQKELNETMDELRNIYGPTVTPAIVTGAAGIERLNAVFLQEILIRPCIPGTYGFPLNDRAVDIPQLVSKTTE